MGWAERLNTNADWHAREARRVAEREARYAVEKEIEARTSIGKRIADWLYGRTA